MSVTASGWQRNLFPETAVRTICARACPKLPIVAEPGKIGAKLDYAAALWLVRSPAEARGARIARLETFAATIEASRQLLRRPINVAQELASAPGLVVEASEQIAQAARILAWLRSRARSRVAELNAESRHHGPQPQPTTTEWLRMMLDIYELTFDRPAKVGSVGPTARFIAEVAAWILNEAKLDGEAARALTALTKPRTVARRCKSFRP